MLSPKQAITGRGSPCAAGLGASVDASVDVFGITLGAESGCRQQVKSNEIAIHEMFLI
jgi:hypothetical protein